MSSSLVLNDLQHKKHIYVIELRNRCSFVKKLLPQYCVLGTKLISNYF